MFFFCKRCHTTHGPRQCPAYKVKCGNCKVYGHYVVACTKRSKQPKIRRTINTLNINNNNYDVDDDVLYVNTIENNNFLPCREKFWSEKLRINDTLVEFKLDSGAEVNVLSYEALRKIDENAVIIPTDSVIEAYGGEKLNKRGICNLVTSYKNKTQR